MLYGANGQVLARSPSRARTADRQDEVAAEVRKKLKAIDELLDIVYVDWAGRYSLICNWPQSDDRWKMFQSGEIGAAYDSLGWFTEDIQDPTSLPVSVDSIENLILERLASCDNTKFHWKDRMRQIIDKNAKKRKSNQQLVIDRAQDVAETLWNAAGHLDNHAFERLIEEVADGKAS